VGLEGQQRTHRLFRSFATGRREAFADRAAAEQPYWPLQPLRPARPQARGFDAKSQAPVLETIAEQEMESKRQQERADSERKAQEEQQKSAAKAAECERARGYLRGLEEGQRVVRTDASGNREYLDDAQREAEIERTRKMVQSLCS
jgi:hypothetical protein